MIESRSRERRLVRKVDTLTPLRGVAASVSLAVLLAGCASGRDGAREQTSGNAGTSSTDRNPPSAGAGAPDVIMPGLDAAAAPGVRGALPPGLLRRDPGRATLRRLTRAEYDNTVRDLLGTAQRPGRTFLNDSPDIGFDNNADLASLSPAQTDLYRRAAEALAAEAMEPPLRAALVQCDLIDASCVEAFIAEFGGRAFRRPLADREVAAYAGLFEKATNAGASSGEALRTVLEAFLISPHFLFRVEIDDNPASLLPHAVGQYEMATRLSYLLYASMPDDALFEAAREGRLVDPDDIVIEVERMLDDPKGRGFTESFALQWLGLRRLSELAPDPAVFPSFTPALGQSMQTEVRSFFEEFVREDRPPHELLTANFTYVDQNLSRHYGLAAAGEEWMRVELDTPERGGLLAMAGPLLATSPPGRTSVVRRGAWVLGSLLCATPPPPPPDIAPLEEDPASGTTQRELLAEHRKNPTCASCHTVMDNIGLGLENYDAVGAYRELDNGSAVDASGELEGVSFEGPRELAALLSQDPRLGACFARQVMTYALGRTLARGDDAYLAEIADGTADGAVGVRELLMRIVRSEPFRLRRGEPAGATR